MYKRGQGWGIDLIIGGIIVIAGIIAFYGYLYNLDTEENSALKELQQEGEFIASQLLEEGVPSDWTPSSVSTIGITTADKINQTKLEYLAEMIESNYNSTKQLLRTKHDFMINMSAPLYIEGNEVSYLGRAPVNPENSMKISRITIYNNQAVTFWVITWE